MPTLVLTQEPGKKGPAQNYLILARRSEQVLTRVASPEEQSKGIASTLVLPAICNDTVSTSTELKQTSSTTPTLLGFVPIISHVGFPALRLKVFRSDLSFNLQVRLNFPVSACCEQKIRTYCSD